MLILQTQNNLSDERSEFYLRDRLSWMRFLGLGLGRAVRTPTLGVLGADMMVGAGECRLDVTERGVDPR